MAKVLVVDDDRGLALMVQNWLLMEGHTADVVYDGTEALERLQHYHYELAILDWQLPGLSGIEICRTYRQAGGNIPILMLTGKTVVSDKKMGLDMGADDYVTKPFEVEELGARVRALLRRSGTIKPTVLRVRNIELDPVSGTVTKDGAYVKLVRKEFALLEFFMRHPNQLFTSEALIERVWSSESDSMADTIRPYIYRLRSKLDDPDKPSLWVTVHGMGYKFVVAE